jgi:hypothetical protein
MLTHDHTNYQIKHSPKMWCLSHKCLYSPDGSVSQVVGLPSNSYNDLSMIWKMTMSTNCPILIYDKKIIVSWNTLWVRILLRRGVLDTPLCDKACQWLTAGRWFSPGTPFSSTNKTDRHDIAEILLKRALNTTTLTLLSLGIFWFFSQWVWISVHNIFVNLSTSNYQSSPPFWIFWEYVWNGDFIWILWEYVCKGDFIWKLYLYISNYDMWNLPLWSSW